MRKWWAAQIGVEAPLRRTAQSTPAAAVLLSSRRARHCFTPANSTQRVLSSAAAPTSALHSSRLLRKPFIPTVVRSAEVAEALHDARHRSDRNAVSSVTIHELSLISIDDLSQRVHRFSRTNFSPAQRPLLYAHLKEIMKPQRMAQIAIKPLHDYLHLAHAAGLHETCLEVYHAAREHMPPTALSLHSKAAQRGSGEAALLNSNTPEGGIHHLTTSATATTSINTATGAAAANTGSGSSGNLIVDSAVLVSNYVVDSAYALRSSAELTRLASYCVSQLLNVPPTSQTQQQLQRTVDTDASLSSSLATQECIALAVRSPRATVVEVSLVRCLWRALCLAEYYKCTEANGKTGVKGDAEQALADATAILEGCQRVGARRRAAEAQLNADAAQPVPRGLESTPANSQETADLLRKTLHFVRYASVGDDGEFAFFHFCKEKGILSPPRPLKHHVQALEGSGPVAAPSSFSPVYDADEVQVFYGSLIETCSAGQLVPEAMEYFSEARRLLGGAPLGDEEVNSADVLLGTSVPSGGVEGREDSSLPPASTAPPPPPPPVMPHAPAAPAPPTSPPLSPPHSESHGRAATGSTAGTSGGRANAIFTDFLIHRLLFTLQAAKDNRRSVRLARALIASGAAENVKVNLWTLLLISAGTMRAVDVALAAHRHAMQQLTAMDGAEASGSERRTWAYLLQTALSALSKCQLPHYEQDYLQPAQESGLLHCTDEFYYGCLLQDAHNSMNPRQRASEVLSRMGEANVPLTAPLITRLLKLYLRLEAGEFFDMYRHAAEELQLRRVQWTDQLVLWADRRRYFLSMDDRAYIVDEVMRSRNVSDVARLLPMLGGLRAQFALLHYDLTHAARDQFLHDGTLPKDAPTMQDSRAHFLTARGASVQRGIMAPVEAAWVCANHPSIGESDDGAEDGAGTEHYGVQPHMLGDCSRRTLLATIAELSEAPLMLPAGGEQEGSLGVSGEEGRLHDEALRVYLADVLEGLQRSLNSVS